MNPKKQILVNDFVLRIDFLPAFSVNSIKPKTLILPLRNWRNIDFGYGRDKLRFTTQIPSNQQESPFFPEDWDKSFMLAFLPNCLTKKKSGPLSNIGIRRLFFGPLNFLDKSF
ncbi:hypothetical protein P872_03645 [Rhodonellum psychrophilum GCM71 = DSM 17998]|uniref:Uncharacterized protein n=1 Tax=Rhodonellum psychrophilum GCM71 = DSM 17998 TaxID=1123057 RepID=U5C3J2_9BACT|nr:hypothetical protein P872_03645 [Rhodonellum psychrophilum GCM71 = DSM 17998]